MAASMAGRVSSVFRAGLFRDRAAIVTGGGGGLGSAITKELLHLGCKVLIASRNAERLKAAAEEMQKVIPEGSTARIEYHPCNIRKEDEVKSMVAAGIEKFGKIDFLVNNGGGQFISPAENINAKGWHAVIETNLYGTFYCCREVYTQCMEEHGGAIVNIIADMWKGMPGMSHSGAARAGVWNLTKSLAVEWARSGVRVNAIAPGTFPSPTARANYGEEITFDLQKSRVPAKRLGNPEEVSGAVSYLLSPAASYISGECITIDGAHTLHSTLLGWPLPDHSNCPDYTWEKDLQQLNKDLQQPDKDNKSKL